MEETPLCPLAFIKAAQELLNKNWTKPYFREKFLHVPKGTSRNSLSCVAQEDLRKRRFILWYPGVGLGSLGCGGLASGWSEFGLFTVQPRLDKDI